MIHTQNFTTGGGGHHFTHSNVLILHNKLTGNHSAMGIEIFYCTRTDFCHRDLQPHKTRTFDLFAWSRYHRVIYFNYVKDYVENVNVIMKSISKHFR